MTAQWRCLGCGETFTNNRTSHGRHAPWCNGDCADCPIECGPVVRAEGVPTMTRTTRRYMRPIQCDVDFRGSRNGRRPDRIDRWYVTIAPWIAFGLLAMALAAKVTL